MMTRQQAKASLKSKGLSQRKAAPLLDVTFEHLNRVLNGHRQSQRLLAKIGDLTSADSLRTNSAGSAERATAKEKNYVAA